VVITSDWGLAQLDRGKLLPSTEPVKSSGKLLPSTEPVKSSPPPLWWPWSSRVAGCVEGAGHVGQGAVDRPLSALASSKV
jgi:hypothetical protein